LLHEAAFDPTESTSKVRLTDSFETCLTDRRNTVRIFIQIPEENTGHWQIAGTIFARRRRDARKFTPSQKADVWRTNADLSFCDKCSGINPSVRFASQGMMLCVRLQDLAGRKIYDDNQ